MGNKLLFLLFSVSVVEHNMLCICCQFSVFCVSLECFPPQPGDSRATAEPSKVLPNGDVTLLRGQVFFLSLDTIDAGMWGGNHWP